MQIRKSDRKKSESNGFGSMLRCDLFNIDETKPHDVATALSKLSKTNCDGLAIMAIEHPEIRDAITRLTGRGSLSFHWSPINRLQTFPAFVGIPNLQAGQTAGQLMLRFQQNNPGQ